MIVYFIRHDLRHNLFEGQKVLKVTLRTDLTFFHRHRNEIPCKEYRKHGKKCSLFDLYHGALCHDDLLLYNTLIFNSFRGHGDQLLTKIIRFFAILKANW